jgi:chemotaxis protein methyltransferase CheR
MKQLELAGITDYRSYLDEHADEWHVLDRLCQVTISRFYRDKLMFAFLEHEVMPALAQQALAQERDSIKVWSAGCGSGEEPYSIALLWQIQLQERFPGLHLHIIATDSNPDLLQRVTKACYPYASIKNLPVDWRDDVFSKRADQYCLKPDYRANLRIMQQDVRETMPTETYDLILCRNLVFTYYDEDLQRALLQRLQGVLRPDGALVIGIHEQLPTGVSGFTEWSTKMRIYRKSIPAAG